MITKRTKHFALSSVFVLAVMLQGFVFLLYVVGDIDREFLQLKSDQAKVEQYSREIVTLSRLVEGTKAERNELNEYILKEQEVIDFLTLIETIGVEHGGTLTIRSWNKSPLGDTFDELVLEVGVIGGYEAVTKMLKIFETLPYQSYVANAGIESESSINGVVTWQGVYTLRVTKYKEL